MKVPISINIDDFAPVVHVYYEHYHRPDKKTKDGRDLLPTIPFSFMEKFCALVENYGAKGKLSVIPLPGCKNPYETEEAKRWMELLNKHIKGKFSFCPEMLTHHLAYDIDNDCFLDINEEDWSNLQGEQELTRYIEYSLRKLKERGVTPTGVTSPWHFGSKVIDNYRNAILNAFANVFGKGNYWFFLDTEPGGKAKVLLESNGSKLVAISATVSDFFWRSIDCPRCDQEFINEMADNYITEDGTSGGIIDTLNLGGHPVILTHWQSLFSNGTECGLRALEVVLDRINKNLADRVEFASYDEKMIETVK